MEFFKFKTQEQPVMERAEKAFENFVDQEKITINKAGKAVENLPSQKLKSKAASLLAAFSIFMGASTAFAEDAKAEAGEKLSPEKQAEELAPKPASPQELFKKITGPTEEEFAPFDWKKVADKIEISIGGEFEKIPEHQPEAVSDIRDYDRIIASDFYKGFSKESVDETIDVFFNSISRSNNSVEFFKNLENQKENLDGKQKVLLFQNLAKLLNKTYNYDMFEEGKTVEVSDEIMFDALKELMTTGEISKTGICGNISTFLTKSAEKLGLEAWLQNGSMKGVNDIFTGITAEINGEKQIAYLTYWGTLIPTGTLDYKDALGVAERYMGRVRSLDSFVGNEKEVLFPVKSRAQEVVKKAAGFEEAGGRLELELAEGKLKKEKGLEIKLSPETKEIKLNKDTFGLAYFNFQDFSSNPYQSLEDLNALRGRINLRDERLGLEADATVVHMNIKDLYGGSVEQKEIIGRLAADYINSHKFAKNEYGQFALNFGATLQAGLRLPLDKKIEISTIGRMGEMGAGMRLIYINPAETGKFYIGAQEMFRGQINDFQNQDLIIKEAAKTLTVGAEVKVNEAQILNLEAARSELDWGKKLEIKGGLAGKEWKGGVEYEKAKSEYERFVPSSEKIGAEVGYKGGPKWEIDVLGSKTTEKYAGAKSKDSYGAEVKLKIFLW